MKQYSFLIAFCISLLGAWFCVVPAQASKEDAKKVIESQILEQLGDGYDLDHWEVVNVEETKQGQATIKKSTIKIGAVDKETLDELEFQGFLIQMNIPGLPQQPNPRVVIVPGQLMAQPSSKAPTNAQAAVQKTPENQPSRATGAMAPAPEPTEPVQSGPGDFDALLKVYGDAGEVWGMNTPEMPVILQNLKKIDGKTLEGTIHYPFQELANPFTMKSLGGMISMEVKAATQADKGVRRDTLSCKAEGEELVARSIRVSRSGIRFALTGQQNSKLKKQFEKQIDPFKSDNNDKDCFFIGGKVLKIDTLETVSDSWVQSDCAIRVKNMPGRFISVELGVGQSSTLPVHQVKTVEPKGRKPIEPLSLYKDNAWVSYDLSEYVVLKDGDVWHGKMDWMGNTIKQERNITHLGMLTNLEPIAWYQNEFYFYSRSGTDKPILRINVKTGDIEEMEETKALQRASLVSPDGRFIFFSDGRGRYLPDTVESLLHIYDCKTHQTFTMDATIDEHRYAGKMKEYPQPVKIGPRQWLSNSLFITNIGWYDLEKRERVLFIEKQGIIRDRPEQFYRVINFSFLPVSDFVDITVQSFIIKEKEFNRRYLVNRTSKKAIELPMEFISSQNNNSHITWIDENRYVFSKTKGSLKEIGTWLYDVRTKTHRRLTPLFSNGGVNAENYCMMPEQKGYWPFPFYFYNQHLVCADKERIVFGVKKGNTPKIVSIPLNGGDIAEIDLEPRFRLMRRILPFSIELPVGSYGGNTRKAIQDFERQQRLAVTGEPTPAILARLDQAVQAETKSNPGSQAQMLAKSETGKSVLKEQKNGKAKSLSNTEEGKLVYEECVSNHRHAANFDCECLAEKAAVMHEQINAEMPFKLRMNEYMGKASREGSCRNITVAIRGEYATCMKGTSFDYRGIPQEDYCECYAETWGKLYEEYEGKLDENTKSNLRMKARMDCYKSFANKNK